MPAASKPAQAKKAKKPRRGSGEKVGYGYQCPDCKGVLPLERKGFTSCPCDQLSIDVPGHSAYMRVIGVGHRVEIKQVRPTPTGEQP